LHCIIYSLEMNASTTTLLVAVVGISMACDVSWLNGTDTHANWYQCNECPILLFSATTFDSHGNYGYPICLSKLLVIKADIDNPNSIYGSPNFRNATNTWRWTSKSGCVYKRYFACTNGISCQIDIVMNFPPYSFIISFLKDDAPYQLQTILHDGVTEEDVACITFQARARLV
uniref:ML domain-containing protein n=1 Tax=Angiostrongylus cantonensis TaxID=6313 RepID=A0A0K0D889_ANGCA